LNGQKGPDSRMKNKNLFGSALEEKTDQNHREKKTSPTFVGKNCVTKKETEKKGVRTTKKKVVKGGV